MRLAGRVAVITGAGQGGGMGAALALAADGAAVVLFGRTLSKLEQVAAAVVSRGGKAVAFGGNVTKEPDLKAVVATALSRFGRLDILVNAAQSTARRNGRLLDADPAVFAELWSSGPAATLSMMRLAHPHLAKQGGSIINFGSGAEMGPASYGAYAAAKAAIRTLSRAAAVEWAGAGIRCNVVVPMVSSPALDADPTGREVLTKSIPMGRIGDPEQDIGRPIAFLASDESAFITGCTLMLDGGLTYFG